MSLEYLRDEVQEIGEKNGATLFGVANLLPYKDYIKEVYGEKPLQFPYAISLGIPYPKEVVNELIEAPTHTYLYYYKILNAKLDDIALQVAIHLEKAG